MKSTLIFFTLILVATHSLPLKSSYGSDATVSKSDATAALSQGTSRIYPIAPGIWSPGEPVPEKPVRYYRVRCWPGCHRGSSHGMYPDLPLDMDPVFWTSTIDLWPPARSEKK